MWNKLKNKLTDFFSTKNESVSKNLIDLAIVEIQNAAKKNQESLNKTLENQKNIFTILEQHQQEAAYLYKAATLAVKKGQEIEAKNILEKKAFIDKQVQQYDAIHQNLTNTVQQLQNQLAQLKFREEEIKTKELILKTKLQNANSQKELNEVLSELEKSEHFQLYETELEKIAIENELTNDLLSLDKEFDSLTSNDNVAQMRAKIAQEEQQKKEQQLQNQFKKINQIFAQQEEQQKKEIEDKKQILLQELLKSKATQTEQLQEAQKRIDDFFSNRNPSDKNKIVDDFFKQDDKQKKIDDFFKN